MLLNIGFIHKMLKIQTKLDWHASKQPLLLLFPSRKQLVKLEFTLWFSCSCHEMYFTRVQTVSNGPDGGLKLCWSLPSKESRMFSVVLSTGLIIIQKGRRSWWSYTLFTSLPAFWISCQRVSTRWINELWHSFSLSFLWQVPHIHYCSKVWGVFLWKCLK